MNPVINFVELENRVISATYRNLMIGAKVMLLDKTSGKPMADPVTRIASSVPNGKLRIRLPETFPLGAYCLQALNAHGDFAAQSVAFYVS
jgi:hypothetical protein